jgi:hypothetical protein
MPKHNKKQKNRKSRSKSRGQPRGKPGPTIYEWVSGWPLWGYIKIICM